MIRNVGLVINYRKKKPVLFGKELVKWFAQKGIRTYAPVEDGRVLEMEALSILPNLGNNVDCVIVLGGDGTFLRAARLMAPYGVPILGINLGTMGFLTEIEVGEAEESLEQLIRGQYLLEDRMMLEAKVVREGQVINSFVGLNDVVINKGPLARINTLEVYIDQEFATVYKSDGIIISSPTGSTAYSLSAGGPIVYPEVDVIILTPICPHTLHSRPMVIPSHKTIRVNIVYQQSGSSLTIDGQHCSEVLNGDVIVVGKAAYYARLVRLKKFAFFDVLREKLKAERPGQYE